MPRESSKSKSLAASLRRNREEWARTILAARRLNGPATASTPRALRAPTDSPGGSHALTGVPWEVGSSAESGIVEKLQADLPTGRSPDQTLVDLTMKMFETEDQIGLHPDSGHIFDPALLGFKRPDLLTEAYKTASPVQAVLTQNVSYQSVIENGWDVEGINMSTAFLQTLPTEEARRMGLQM